MLYTIALIVGMAMPSLNDFDKGPGMVKMCDDTVIVVRPHTLFHGIAAFSFTVRGEPRPYALLWNDGTLFEDLNIDGKIDGIVKGQEHFNGCSLLVHPDGAV